MLYSPGACSCVDGWYASSTNPLECSECHNDCTTCNGGTGSDCKRCAADNTWIRSIPGSCSCKDGWYASSTNPLECTQCHDDCTTCNGNTSSDC